MSDLATTYALQIGVTLDRPTIMESFFPLNHPYDKSILLHGFGGSINNNQAQFPSKIYDYYGEVIALLKPIVEPLGYKLFQIGGPGEPNINGVESLCGQTAVNQCAYLVKRCALLIGNDSMWVHQRGAFNGALVALYGPTDNKNHGPHWRNPNKTITLESHRFGRRTTYSSHEGPKTINLITPESVTNAALSLLDQPPINHQSLYFGDAYNQPLVELVPNIVVSPQTQVPNALIVRMDYHFDEQILAGNLQIRKCAIISDREIDLNILAQFKGNIASLRLEIDKISPDWIKKAKRLGVPMACFAVENDEAKLRKMRLDYFDACFFDKFAVSTADEFRAASATYLNKSLDKDLKLDSLRFKTHKFMLSENKIYLSKAHWEAGIDTPSTAQNSAQVIDSVEFFQDYAHFYVYSQ